MSLIANLYTDPKALRQLGNWNCDYNQNSDGKYVYTGNDNVWAAILHGIKQGCVIAVDFNTDRRDAFGLESCQVIYKSSTTLAGVYQGGGNCSLHCSGGKGVSATVNRIGLYSQDDWKRLQQYGLDWFDGDLMPRQN